MMAVVGCYERDQIFFFLRGGIGENQVVSNSYDSNIRPPLSAQRDTLQDIYKAFKSSFACSLLQTNRA